jgi:hypothetical protein
MEVVVCKGYDLVAEQNGDGLVGVVWNGNHSVEA